jgi:hypothetical protein
MEKPTGSIEMIELVNRYSILSEPTTTYLNSSPLTSESRAKEVVVGHYFPHFSAPTDEY